MIKSLLFSFIICGAAIGHSQQRISGTVKDAESGAPLPFAHVQVMNSTIGTVTNNSGEFSLFIPIEQTNAKLGVSYLGYENSFIQLTETTDGLIIRLKPIGISLPDLIISAKSKSLIDEAVEAIPHNHDQSDMKLRGFWRASIKGRSDYLQISESAFDIYRSDGANYLNTLKGRIARDSAAMARLSNFNAGIRPNRLFEDSFLKEHVLLSKKTRENHDYDLTDIQTFNGRNVYVLTFDRKDKSKMNGYQGTIWLDVETLAFVKITARYSPKNGEQLLFEDDKFIAMLAGLSKSTMNSYFVELGYRQIDEKWYVTHAKYDVQWTMIRDKKNVNELIRYTGDFVVTDLTKIFALPADLTFEKNRMLEQQKDFKEDDYWKDFTYLIPDEDMERIFREIENRNGVK